MWQERLDKAETTLAEAVRIAKKTALESYPDLVAAALRQYATVLRKNGKTAEAEKCEIDAEGLELAKGAANR